MYDDGERILRDVLAAADNDKALPSPVYTSRAFFEMERERLFKRTWVFVGCGQEIPKPGDALPTDVAGFPIVVLRNRDGSFSAFHNVCPHRGAVIVTKPCKNLKTLTCPYHSWTFNLDGSLRMRPYYHGGKKHDVADHSSGHQYPKLVDVRVDTWADMIFINIDGKAPSLSDHLKPAIDFFDGYNFDVMRLSETLTFNVEANWKLPIENFYDNYHIFSIHPLIDAGLSQEHRGPSEWVGGPFIKGGYRVEGDAADWIKGMERNPDISDRLKNTNTFICLAPNVLAQVWDFTVVLFQIIPVTETYTRERIHLYYFGDSATDPKLAGIRKVIADNWKNINQNEDIGIVENMQKARVSPAFDSGELSPFWDGATAGFTKIIAEIMR